MNTAVEKPEAEPQLPAPVARRGIHLDGGIELRGGHWCVSRNGFWIRTTDVLQMEVMP